MNLHPMWIDGTLSDEALSVAMFGRDIAGLAWDDLTPAEKQAIRELAEGRLHERVHEMSMRASPVLHGYVSRVDQYTRGVQVSSGAPPIDADDPTGPLLLYHLAVAIGAQPPIAECWPR
jgi:hypothetical protein